MHLQALSSLLNALSATVSMCKAPREQLNWLKARVGSDCQNAIRAGVDGCPCCCICVSEQTQFFLDCWAFQCSQVLVTHQCLRAMMLSHDVSFAGGALISIVSKVRDALISPVFLTHAILSWLDVYRSMATTPNIVAVFQ
jgi:hypothetical protein